MTKTIWHWGIVGACLAALGVGCDPSPHRAEAAPSASSVAARPAVSAAPSAARDGQHDFDFLFGTWKVHVRRLKNPLHGSNEWFETSGTSVVRPIWGGKGNVEEIQNDGPSGHMEALMVRLYSPESRQWSLNWTTQKQAHF